MFCSKNESSMENVPAYSTQDAKYSVIGHIIAICVVAENVNIFAQMKAKQTRINHYQSQTPHFFWKNKECEGYNVKMSDSACSLSFYELYQKAAKFLFQLKIEYTKFLTEGSVIMF